MYKVLSYFCFSCMSEREKEESNDPKKVLMVGHRKRGRGNEGASTNYPPGCHGSQNRF